LSTVNYRPLSTYQPGYKIPNSDQYVWGGELDFTTKEWDAETHTGYVWVHYFVKNGRGIQEETGRYTGTFSYNKKNDRVVLRANGQTLLADLDGNTMSMTGGLPQIEQTSVAFVRATTR
jgi:hypothetical protein